MFGRAILSPLSLASVLVLPLLLVAAGCHRLLPYDEQPPSATDGAPDWIVVDDRGPAGPDLDLGPVDAIVAPERPTPPDASSPGQEGGAPADASPDSAWSPPGQWVHILADTFYMGSPTSEPCRDPLSETRHHVQLTRGFVMQSTEVTQDQFATLMTYNPSGFSGCGGTCPVETVNWHEAAAYCTALSARAGLTACYQCLGGGKDVRCSPAFTGKQIYACPGFRLPTEAEWEYAYRAGTQTAYYNGAVPPDMSACTYNATAAAIGWYADNASSPHPVGTKAPNAWGLYDMAGNVWEWVHDWSADPGANVGSKTVVDPAGVQSPPKQLVRGGSWHAPAGELRAAMRQGMGATLRGGSDGFRCVRTVSP